jgi:hypothetical protein
MSENDPKVNQVDCFYLGHKRNCVFGRLTK